MSFKLMSHQKEAVEFALRNNGVAAFFHEVGCGKTLSALTTFTELRKKDPNLRMVVFCPLSLIYGAWAREIEKFTDFTWIDLHSGKGDRYPDIFLINFESTISLKRYQELIDILKKGIGNWMCVIDESSKLKNNRTKTVERILELKRYFKHRIVMSGTPAPNVEWEYWPQMYFLNDTILGGNFYQFKNTHFALKRGNQFMPGQFLNRAAIRKMHEQGFKYEIIPAKKDLMFARMKPWCHQVKAAECLDLPEELDEFRTIEMTTPQAKIYKQMKEAYIAELPPGTFAVANVVLTKLMKLRQITSGFAIDDKGQASALDTNNPKINALLDVVEESGHQQMIIWCQFHWEIDLIVKELSAIAGVSQLHGRIPHQERNDHLNNFLNGTNRFLVAHPDSAAHGLTLTNCHIAVFFSMDYSMEGYSQARGRIYRNGQKNNCLYIHLIAKGTIDEDVLAIVQRKETAHEVAARYLQHGVSV